MSKGGFQWPSAFRVAPNMTSFETGVLRKHTPCRPEKLTAVAEHIAEVHAEFLLIHPFRDGNGRMARWMADLMAIQADYPMPQYRFSGRRGKIERQRYLAAVQRGYFQDYSPLTAFFREAIAARLSGLEE